MTGLPAALADARSLRFERTPPPRIEAIVIVGSTCAGKTTLASVIRDAALAGVDIPRRFVTRAPRADDVAAEAGYLTSEAFDAAIAAGDVLVHWSRTLEPGRIERYAFAAPSAGTLAVYSANNAIVIRDNVRPADALAHALLVGVFAPDDVREQRLRTRSPALWRERPGEARARLAETAAVMLSHVHVVVENHGALESAARSDVVALVRAACALRAV